MGENNFPHHFSDIFSKTLCYVYMGCLKSLTLGRETQFWTLGFISPLFLYNYPLLRIFPIVKRPMTSSDFISRDLSLIFLHAGLNLDLVLNQKQNKGEKCSPSSSIFKIFFKNFVLGSWGCLHSLTLDRETQFCTL